MSLARKLLLYSGLSDVEIGEIATRKCSVVLLLDSVLPCSGDSGFFVACDLVVGCLTVFLDQLFYVS